MRRRFAMLAGAYLFAAAALASSLAGCVTGIETPDGSAGMTAFGGVTTFQTAAAGGCRAAISEFETVMENDRDTGNVNQSVYRKVMADLQGPKAACAAGRDGEAASRLGAVKARYGYH